jgi:hypothetical protein
MKGRAREQPGTPAAPIMTEDPMDKALEQLLVEVGKETQPHPQDI